MSLYLSRKLMQWTIRGVIPYAVPLRDREGWRLTLCLRARITFTLIGLMLLAIPGGCVILQIFFPEPLTAGCRANREIRRRNGLGCLRGRFHQLHPTLQA